MEKADIYGYIIVAVVLLIMAFIAWALCRTAGNSDDREEEYWRRKEEDVQKEKRLMKLFKNFKTKKQLRKENEVLKSMLIRPNIVCFVERDVQKIVAYTDTDMTVPGEEVKKEVLIKLAYELEPFVEWHIEDIPYLHPINQRLIGEIYIGKRRKKKEDE